LPTATASALGNVNYFAQSSQNLYHFKKLKIAFAHLSNRLNLHLFKTFASSENVLKVDVTEVGNVAELHQLLK
jgi:hypothetical protein